MRLKGVSYDAGAYMAFNWRPDFDPLTVRREMEIIKNDLHCNAVRITAQDINRVFVSAEAALEQGLEVWFEPVLWDKSPEETLAYIKKGGTRAESLRARWPDKVVFCVGSELTLFMKGIISGRNFLKRISSPSLGPSIKAGAHNKPLNEFLARANDATRAVFKGKVTYASLVWERVNWELFDYVGVDHYRVTSMEDKYIEMLKPSFSFGKPVVVTEFGYATTRGGIGDTGMLRTAGLGGEQIIDGKSQFFHYKLPAVGRFFKLRLNVAHVRDEAWQAQKLVETLTLLDQAGVDGAFISSFISEITPYNENPAYDLDMASMSLVKYYGKGKRGKTYPDMPWDPKQSFRDVAKYYESH